MAIKASYRARPVRMLFIILNFAPSISNNESVPRQGKHLN
eukprot:CAMPEP_0172894672 /NCGR_PEP_ID=MMETSP1075-20121228/151411_2 /TAXON_ID=2916 /ORGANISM="Ceratium fusus, Strain PA161109" /LENGTH=39 /DNA_ID= /DNA_START= /DNA_END= /DNA_ORIENTATION=